MESDRSRRNSICNVCSHFLCRSAVYKIDDRFDGMTQSAHRNERKSFFMLIVNSRESDFFAQHLIFEHCIHYIYDL